jgi:hypothetical protein
MGEGVKSQPPMVLFAGPLDIPSELLYRRGLNLQQDAEIQRLGQSNHWPKHATAGARL